MSPSVEVHVLTMRMTKDTHNLSNKLRMVAFWKTGCDRKLILNRMMKGYALNVVVDMYESTLLCLTYYVIVDLALKVDPITLNFGQFIKPLGVINIPTYTTILLDQKNHLGYARDMLFFIFIINLSFTIFSEFLTNLTCCRPIQMVWIGSAFFDPMAFNRLSTLSTPNGYCNEEVLGPLWLYDGECGCG